MAKNDADTLGEIKYGYKPEITGTIEPIKRNARLGAVSDAFKRAQEFAGQYEVDRRIPLIGGIGVDEMLGLPGVVRETDRWSYGDAPFRINPEAGRTASYVPELKLGRKEDFGDVLSFGLDAAPIAKGAARSAAKKALKVSDVVSKKITGNPNATAMGVIDYASKMAPAAKSIIRKEGGNWFPGDIDEALSPLKKGVAGRPITQQDVDAKRAAGFGPGAMKSIEQKAAINKWIDQKLGKYIQNSMASPSDQLRLNIENWAEKKAELLAKKDQQIAKAYADMDKAMKERGFTPEMMTQSRARINELKRERDVINERTGAFDNLDNIMLPSYNGLLEDVRRVEGFPVEGVGKTPLSKQWENFGDLAIEPTKVWTFDEPMREKHPWLNKLSPDDKVMVPYATTGRRFKALTEGLEKALNPASDIPEHLRLTPEMLGKKTVADVTNIVDEIRAHETVAKREANRARSANAATVPYKDYPDAPYHWVEFKKPEGVEALPHGWSVQESPEGFHLKDTNTHPAYEDRHSNHGPFATEQEARDYAALQDALHYEGDTMQHCVGGYCPPILQGDTRVLSLRNKESGQPYATVELNKFKTIGGKEKQNIAQIKGPKNATPSDEAMPYIQDFVRGGEWHYVDDLDNAKMHDTDFVFEPDEVDKIYNEGLEVPRYATQEEIDKLRANIFDDEPEYAGGGAVKGAIKSGIKGALDLIDDLTGKTSATAAERAAAGRKAADVAKATEPMKMSEALGNLNVEGRGKFRVTQSDRTRVGGGNIGGPMFPGLQGVDPFYKDVNAVWGVGKPSTASALINQHTPDTYWTTLLGGEDQLKSNPVVFNKLVDAFMREAKAGNLSPELRAKINKQLAAEMGEGFDILDPKIRQLADTYSKRAAIGDAFLGKKIGGQKGTIFDAEKILKAETEPILQHPSYGGDVPTFAIGPRLFQFSGDVVNRPDLHPGYPYIMSGTDTGMVFKPAPNEIALRDFNERMLRERGRKPGFHELSKGEKGKGLPSQDITEEYLTHLQKSGYSTGGKVKRTGGLTAARKGKK